MYNTFGSFKAFVLIALMTAISGCGAQKFYYMPRVISKSSVFDKTHINVDITSTADTTYFKIHGDDIEIDFNHTIIDGRIFHDQPNTFKGIGVHIYDSRNVIIKNLTVHGFKIAILAENVENLKIINCDLSYNYRPKLYSKWDRESLSDWLYYHNNEHDEWRRYGAAIYLKNCNNATVREVICHQGFNGLLIVGCQNAIVENNNFSYNSGLGIGLYRSSYNWIRYNKLDWNARGYSHGIYARGQDSAGILLYEQSSHNVIGFNSATHSGDGAFLWAGQYTMDTGLGGCDSNRFYRNDFSHSIANGVEATFSINFIIENKLNDCRYGVWGGYSHHSTITGNEIQNCDYAIAIEHGNHNKIYDNRIANCPIGIQLWQRKTQPSDWPYAQVRDVSSRDYAIVRNQFENLGIAIEASGTDSVHVFENSVVNVNTVTASPEAPSVFITTDPYLITADLEVLWLNPWRDPSALRADILPYLKPPIWRLDGMSVDFPYGTLRGREYIIINEWGPYNFQYPNLVLRNKEDISDQEVLTFAVFGPEGEWSVKSIQGFDSITTTSGTVPDTLIAYRHLDSIQSELVLEFTGDSFINQFGDTVQQGVPYALRFIDQEVQTAWDVAFFQYDTQSDPLTNPESFSLAIAGVPLAMEKHENLAFRWWDEPKTGVPADQFAVRATTDITTLAGEYLFQIESDDGIRLWLDGALVIERWDVHTPMIDEVTIPLLAGRHHVELEYFEATGLAVLDVTISPK
ncbi:MAG TPA: right-handed parallel beta-helix repeat-containing protein [Saprospiraceae bacterium]|nr:right-handed parallel beta-helix repeat-containing protein [Saprospiraceae bacterium]